MYQLHFPSNGTSERAKTGMPREDFEGKLFKNTSSSLGLMSKKTKTKLDETDLSF